MKERPPLLWGGEKPKGFMQLRRKSKPNLGNKGTHKKFFKALQ